MIYAIKVTGFRDPIEQSKAQFYSDIIDDEYSAILPDYIIRILKSYLVEKDGKRFVRYLPFLKSYPGVGTISRVWLNKFNIDYSIYASYDESIRLEDLVVPENLIYFFDRNSDESSTPLSISENGSVETSDDQPTKEN